MQTERLCRNTPACARTARAQPLRDAKCESGARDPVSGQAACSHVWLAGMEERKRQAFLQQSSRPTNPLATLALALGARGRARKHSLFISIGEALV